jgi:hypothetical protein
MPVETAFTEPSAFIWPIAIDGKLAIECQWNSTTDEPKNCVVTFEEFARHAVSGAFVGGFKKTEIAAILRDAADLLERV